MTLPTEPIGSIRRPLARLAAVARMGNSDAPELDPLYEDAIRDTRARFEASGSPIAPDGFRIPFASGHSRRMPRLTAGTALAVRALGVGR